MAHTRKKPKVYKSAIFDKWIVREGVNVFGEGGRIIGQFDSLPKAEKRAIERKEIVGDKKQVVIDKSLYVVS